MSSVDSHVGISLLTLADEVPEEYRRALLEIVALTDEFCQRRLNDEYQQVCRDLAVAICQPGSPVLRGKRASWACGVVYSAGWVNFLTDPSNSPHLRADEIAQGFSVSEGTMHSKAREIRQGLDLVALDPEFCLASRLNDNPLVWMLEVNGLLVDLRTMPREVQQVAFDQGLIPSIPADGDASPRQAIRGRLDEPAATEPQSHVAFQFLVTLVDIVPPVWRRIQVRDCTLDDLHYAIQAAFGWWNQHLYQFQVGKTYFGDIEMLDDHDESMQDSATTLLSKIIPPAGKKKFRFTYEYDFGDSWLHEIELEERLTVDRKAKLPACVAGSRACPPEDCGGPWGYADLLAALANPDHESHADLLDWSGPLDPERFDLKETAKRMRRAK